MKLADKCVESASGTFGFKRRGKLLKIFVACFTFFLLASGPNTVSSAYDNYLATAFSTFEANDFPKPSEEQQHIINRTIQAIEEAAKDRQHFGIDENDASKIGKSGLQAIALLLKSEDAWIRGMAAQTLVALDQRSSVPFLVGLLTDPGSFDWMNDVIGNTVSETARYLLRSLIPRTFNYRLSLSALNNEWEEMKALQHWIAFHIVYYEWQEDPKYGFYKFNPVALYTRTPSRELNRVKEEDPKKFEEILVIWAKGSSSGRREIYNLGSPITIQFIFQNFGTNVTNVLWDKTDRSIHWLRLVGPNGQELSIRPNSIAPWPTPVLLPQPLFSGGVALGWDLDLQKAYDLSKEGIYRLYYSYIPPSKEQDNSPLKIPKVPPNTLKKDVPLYGMRPVFGNIMNKDGPLYSKKTELQFWDGREYVNYYEFLIKAK